MFTFTFHAEKTRKARKRSESERMAEHEKEGEIEVRTLSGESTMVTISPDKTINHLKLFLTQTFPPASSSPNFHLFFKGVKLTLHTHIGALAIHRGEFLVLIPFIKKDRPQTPNPNFATNEVPKQTPISSYADSAYSDMMQELSSLVDQSNNSSAQPSYKADNMFSGYKRKWDFDNSTDCSTSKDEGPYSFLWNVLQSPNKNIIEEQNCEKFIEVLESLNCLTNPHSGKCALLASWGNCDIGVCGDKNGSCLCPSWLKRIMRAFAFLNIFSAFLQMQKEEITSAGLKVALKQLEKFGFRAGFEDIEHISVLSPKVIDFLRLLFAMSSVKLAIKSNQAVLYSKFSSLEATLIIKIFIEILVLAMG